MDPFACLLSEAAAEQFPPVSEVRRKGPDKPGLLGERCCFGLCKRIEGEGSDYLF